MLVRRIRLMLLTAVVYQCSDILGITKRINETKNVSQDRISLGNGRVHEEFKSRVKDSSLRRER